MITYRMQILIERELHPVRVDADTRDTDGPDTVFYDVNLREICRIRTAAIQGEIIESLAA